MLHWLHIVISNAKAFILEPITVCKKKAYTLTSTSTVSALAAVLLGPLSWSAGLGRWDICLVVCYI